MLTVERNAKFPSNQTVADQCTVENVTLSEDLHAGIKLTNLLFDSFPKFFLFSPLVIISRMYILP